METLGDPIKPYLRGAPGNEYVPCREIDTAGILIELTLSGQTGDGRIVQVELIAGSARGDEGFGFRPRFDAPAPVLPPVEPPPHPCKPRSGRSRRPAPRPRAPRRSHDRTGIDRHRTGEQKNDGYRVSRSIQTRRWSLPSAIAASARSRVGQNTPLATTSKSLEGSR